MNPCPTIAEKFAADDHRRAMVALFRDRFPDQYERDHPEEEINRALRAKSARNCRRVYSESKPHGKDWKGAGDLIAVDGVMYRPGDGDETPLCPVSKTVGVQGKLMADAVYLQHSREETGIAIAPEKIAAKRAEKHNLQQQTHTLAERLEAAGYPCYRAEKWSIWTYGVHSGEIEKLPAFRRICFLPYVAAQLRAPVLQALEAFGQSHPFLRFWTFTSGKRCRLTEVNRRCRQLHRRLSVLNAQAFMHAAGAEIIFRSTELGTPEFDENGKRRRESEAGAIERDESGELLFHVHAHCVILLRQALPPDKWADLLRAIWSHWGDNWDEGSAIANLREVCKYVTKPAELLRLRPGELAELARQLYRVKLVQPMGALAEEIKRREEDGLTLIRQRTHDGSVWREVANWNLQGPREKNPDKIEQPDVDHCAVVARCVPSFCALGIKEPRVVVMGTRFDLRSIVAHPLVERLRRCTAGEWQAGLRIRVHTGTPTVADVCAAADCPGVAPDLPAAWRPLPTGGSLQ